jgi:hypothetical protein
MQQHVNVCNTVALFAILGFALVAQACRSVDLREIPRVRLKDMYHPKNWRYASGQAAYILTDLPGVVSDLMQFGSERLRDEFAPHPAGIYWHSMRPAPSEYHIISLGEAISAIHTARWPIYALWSGLVAQAEQVLFPSLPPDLPDEFTDNWSPWASCLRTEKATLDFAHKSKWRLVLIGKESRGCRKSLQIPPAPLYL